MNPAAMLGRSSDDQPATCATSSTPRRLQRSNASRARGCNSSIGMVEPNTGTSCRPRERVTSRTRCSASRALRTMSGTDLASASIPNSSRRIGSVTSRDACAAPRGASCDRCSRTGAIAGRAPSVRAGAPRALPVVQPGEARLGPPPLRCHVEDRHLLALRRLGVVVAVVRRVRPRRRGTPARTGHQADVRCPRRWRGAPQSRCRTGTESAREAAGLSRRASARAACRATSAGT
jgi:hypothetical protein